MGDVLKARTDARDRHRRANSLSQALIETLKPLTWAEGAQSETGLRRLSNSLLEGIPYVDAGKVKRRRRWSATKDTARLSSCQSEWIGFKPTCCGGRAVAVPIGCNHRLCPLCNNHRAERYRSRVQALFAELSNPQLLTLTVPSPRFMTREVLDILRSRLKAFLKEQRPLLRGGVYSIEVTRNRTMKTWHPHIHILVDVVGPSERLAYDTFRLRKWSLEFDWLVLTQGQNKRWKTSDFWRWMSEVRPWLESDKRYIRTNCDRRIVDLRPVTKDRKAAYEVMKYMSKAATFIGDPDALRELMTAIRGVRQIQTFGSCYGFKIDDPKAETHLKCDCGKNVWVPIGTLGLGMVKLSPEGTWFVRDDAPVHGRRQRCRGHST